MAAKIPSAVCMILVIAATMVALFFSTGEAVKYGMCQSECLNIKPNCNAWCKRIGYPKGGECIEPHNIDCCCWEIPPFEKWNETAGISHALHM
ncbi:hypothetical protein ACP70R_008034 [Stipagrostis hirtigluma subsp. patula]